ncbi:hypothetical protein [Mycoplasmoides genitalium]|uniref:hypothetical protein n=1 Tax=Mycoplasmoides genitalium TaxID=2097 RepID=UPI0040556A18
MDSFVQKYTNGFKSILNKVEKTDFATIKSEFQYNQANLEWVESKVSDLNNYLLDSNQFSDVVSFKKIANEKLDLFVKNHGNKLPFFLFTSFVLAIFSFVSVYVRHHYDLDFNDPDAIISFFRELAFHE